MRSAIHNNRGFTLLELVLVLILFSLGSMVLGRALIIGSQIYVQTYERSFQLTEIIKAVHQVKRDARKMVSYPSAITSTTQFRLRRQDGTQVNYRFTQNRLLRNGSKILEDLRDFEFSYFDNDQNPTGNIDVVAFIKIEATSTVGEGAINWTELIYVGK